jgi:hypothetical protein
MKRSLYLEAKELGYKGPLKWIGSSTYNWETAVAELKRQKAIESAERRSRIRIRHKEWMKKVFKPLNNKFIVEQHCWLRRKLDCACRNRLVMIGHYIHSKDKCFYYEISEGCITERSVVIKMLLKRVWVEEEGKFVVEDTDPPDDGVTPHFGQRGALVSHFDGVGDDLDKMPITCSDTLHLPHNLYFRDDYKQFRARHMEKYKIAHDVLPYPVVDCVLEYI